MTQKSRRIASAPWVPRFTITPRIAGTLMRVSAGRAVLDRAEVPAHDEDALRHSARVRSTHYSTRIEGNRLTLQEVELAVGREPLTAPERDVREVRNYWNALFKVEEWAADGSLLTEGRIRQLHALVDKGPRAVATPYRDGQNAIRDSSTGRIVYLPPEAADVGPLMAGMVAWLASAVDDAIPVPLVAGLAHCQFVTIHPFFDGNGRTARLLTTFILRRAGYDLNGMLCLDERHALEVSDYYRALATHPLHNYYDGRANADLTEWLDYFTGVLERAFADAGERLQAAGHLEAASDLDAAGQLDARGRVVVSLFRGNAHITAHQIAARFGFSDRAARTLLHSLVERGVLVVHNPSNRLRSYQLSEVYRHVAGKLSEAEE